MATLFISDLHLSDERPEITALFVAFLRTQATHADALYILGDLFEYWAGDDAAQPDQRAVIRALREAADRGLPLFFMHGNRDFLIGKMFAAESGCRLLDDPTVVDLHGERALLMHGDTLCTDDHDYQQFRAMVRDDAWQQRMLARPVAERIALARQYRAASKEQSEKKMPEIMDVNPREVTRIMQHHDVGLLIHGHTHRPAIHTFTIGQREHRRIVLGDWYVTGSVLVVDERGYRLENVGP